MLSSIILLYRQGISYAELDQKIEWLGQILNERGAHFASDTGLPDKQTLRIGLEQLESYLQNKQGVYEPKLVKGDYKNFLMLYYFRNPIN